MHLVVATAAFLASTVECVEAFTIVLAVGVTKGWRNSLVGALLALMVLAVVVAVFGVALVRYVPISVLRLVVGVPILLFGLRWMRKALLRFSGYKAPHDEAEAFREEEEMLRRHQEQAQGKVDWFAATISFKGVLLEGLEVAFIVITFGSTAGALPSAAAGALAAAVLVAVVGAGLRAPLEAVPENWLKFAVGVLLTTFGTFWAGEGLGVRWPGEDLVIPVLLATYLLFSLAATSVLRRRRAEKLEAAGSPR